MDVTLVTPQTAPITADTAAQPTPTMSPTDAPADAPKPTPKEEEKPEPKQDPKIAAKFAALAREEKRLRMEREKFKSERSEWEKKYQDQLDIDKQIEEDPLGFLQKRKGITYNDLTKRILNDNKLTPEEKMKKLEERLEQFQRQQVEEKEQSKRSQEEEAKKYAEAQVESQIKAFMGNISEFVEKNAEKLELTKFHPEGTELIYNVIEQHYAENGRILSVEEAAESVESYLEEEARKLTSLKKLQMKVEAKEAQAVAPAKDAQSGKTLTNSHATEVPAPTDRKLSPEESKKKAAQLIRWS